jgi:hypothetical protein
MKILPGTILMILATLGISCNRDGWSEEGETWNVDCDLQVVSLPQELALPFVSDLRNPRRSEGAFKDIQKLIAEKRAILVGWPFLTTKSGQRAVVEQIDEFRYANEYDIPGSTTTTETPAAPTGADLLVDGKPDAEPAKSKSTTIGRSEGGPTAFETRNVGVTFEVEPVIAPDGESIDVNFVPQHVHFLKWERASVQIEPGSKVTVDQPRFVTNKLTTSMTFRNGERKLVGLFKAIEPVGNMELFILRVDAQKQRVKANRRLPFGGPR